MKIDKVVEIKKLTLLVYYTPGKCWQYAIAGKDGSYESEEIYYTADAAEKQGREQIQLLLAGWED
jgi:hypothetical protein